jgi:hypothetical protein
MALRRSRFRLGAIAPSKASHGRARLGAMPNTPKPQEWLTARYEAPRDRLTETEAKRLRKKHPALFTCPACGDPMMSPDSGPCGFCAVGDFGESEPRLPPPFSDGRPSRDPGIREVSFQYSDG